MRLLIATHNAGKKAEFAQLLQSLGLELVNLDDVGLTHSVEETGATFAENALLKARAFSAESQLLTLADDSGLEVDALGGAPGVLTARYGGEGLTDVGRYRLLLAQLHGVPVGSRQARFRCVIALAWPDGRSATVEGVCAGEIALAPRGVNGFGYDPIFYLPEWRCTMAELPTEIKNRISHRARAAEAARALLSQPRA